VSLGVLQRPHETRNGRIPNDVPHVHVPREGDVAALAHHLTIEPPGGGGQPGSFSLAGQLITLTSGEVAITKNLDIEGLGAGMLTVSGNNASRIFDISGGERHHRRPDHH